jgi:hypothetical protein
MSRANTIWAAIATIGLGAGLVAIYGFENRTAPEAMGVSDSPGAQMLDAYVVLMNDEDLLDKGMFGGSRVPQPPGAGHGRGPLISYDSPSRQRIIDLRREVEASGGTIGDGFIRTRPAPRGGAPGDVPVWTHFFGASNPANTLRARQEFNTATAEALQRIAKDRSAIYVKQIGTSTMMAKAIPFQSKTCLNCHTDAKVGDTAAIAAVVIRPKPPAQADMGRNGQGHNFDVKTERVFGLPTYPEASCPDGPSFGSQGGFVFSGQYRTDDSADAVLAYYERMIRTKEKPFVQVRRMGDGRVLRYEFGDVYHGTITCGSGSEGSWISYEMRRFVRPGDLGTR